MLSNLKPQPGIWIQHLPLLGESQLPKSAIPSFPLPILFQHAQPSRFSWNARDDSRSRKLFLHGLFLSKCRALKPFQLSAERSEPGARSSKAEMHRNQDLFSSFECISAYTRRFLTVKYTLFFILELILISLFHLSLCCSQSTPLFLLRVSAECIQVKGDNKT